MTILLFLQEHKKILFLVVAVIVISIAFASYKFFKRDKNSKEVDNTSVQNNEIENEDDDEDKSEDEDEGEDENESQNE